MIEIYRRYALDNSHNDVVISATHFQKEILKKFEQGQKALKIKHSTRFERATFASGVQSHQSALYGLPSTNP